MLVHYQGRPIALKEPHKTRRGSRYISRLWDAICAMGHDDKVRQVIRTLANGNTALIDDAVMELTHYWTYEYATTATSRWGCCVMPRPTRPHGTVQVSEVLLQANHEKDLRGTFLHEVAHALVEIFISRKRRVRPHGREWQAVMRRLGERPDRTSTGSSEAAAALREKVLAQAKVVYGCARCRAQFARKRRLNATRSYTHKGCGGEVLRVR